MSSCVRPRIQSKSSPVVLLHGFDRYNRSKTCLISTTVEKSAFSLNLIHVLALKLT